MKKTTVDFIPLTLCFCLLLLFACGTSGSESNPSAESPVPGDKPANFSDVVNPEQGKAAYEADAGGNNPLMEHESFRKIAAFLPATANGVTGDPAEGWAEGVNGVPYTLVKKTYRNRDHKTRLDLSVSDAGKETLESLNLVKYWYHKTINTKSANGHERTRTYKSYPAFEKCDGISCDVYVAVDNRFLIAAHLSNMELDDLFSVFEPIDIDQLKQLAK